MPEERRKPGFFAKTETVLSSDARFLEIVEKTSMDGFELNDKNPGREKFAEWLGEATAERGIKTLTKSHIKEFSNALVKQKKLDHEIALEFARSVYSKYAAGLTQSKELFHVEGTTPSCTPAATPPRTPVCSPKPGEIIEHDSLFPMEEDEITPSTISSVRVPLDIHISLFKNPSIFSLEKTELLFLTSTLGF